MVTTDSNFFFEASPRILVIGDVHGDLERLISTLQTVGIIDSELAWVAEPRNTIVVQLGDQLDSVDRGPGAAAGWEKSYDMEVVLFMDRLDQTARRSGGRVISLLGNHELMNVLSDFSYVSPQSMNRSGGEALRRARFSPGGTWARLLSKRPVICKIGRNLFCHGGLLPWHIMACDGDLQLMNRIVHKWLLLGPDALAIHERLLLDTCILGQDGILWTRNYLQMATYAPDLMEPVLGKMLGELGASAIYVGHNTMERITPMLGGRIWFMDAQFSRAYGARSVQVLEIRNDGEFTQTITLG